MKRVAPLDAWLTASQRERAGDNNARRQTGESPQRPGQLCVVGLEHIAPVSWKRLLLFVCPCLLLLTDVARGGLGEHSFADNYIPSEPDTFVDFGPFAYPVATINATQVDSDQSLKVWNYKHDTTSLAMRAAAIALNVSTWPSCVLHEGPCPSDTLGDRTVFQMFDALVNAIEHLPQSLQSTRPSVSLAPITMATDIKYMWLDRVHDHVLRQYFGLPTFRTNRYLYFHPSVLALHALRGFCAMSPSTRPHSCSEMWTHFKRVRMKRGGNDERRGDVWTDVSKRVRAFQAKYPSNEFQVDLLVLDSSDLQSKSRMSYRGSRYFDIVTIMRARRCGRSVLSDQDDDANCTTVVIDDYRYEGGVETLDVVEWFNVIATLRMLGQAYMWLRVLLLWGGSYIACRADPACVTAAWHHKCLLATRIMFLIPAQVVIYGSIIPIACYTVAHWMDSAATHERIADLSRTPATGLLNMDFRKYVDISTVLMRNVWPFALTLHVIIWFRTSRGWTRTHGVVGMSEFWISIVSALTTFAHYRFISLRNSTILSVSLHLDNAVSMLLKTRRSGIGGGLFLCQWVDL
ncbi:TPA: hypothetical protein N0F65_001359 [Lagenidium giganteum]|uniref:Uncharacterized protein n=1 Tax=Lagenidium giganteum TaxID=4803 RepID=A0AAV2YY13_9STRA|nr:TPA: hypothetical protein N0F65_001359 [Lagenidium giganteum]